MNKLLPSTIAFCALSILLVQGSEAQVYKWKDANGQTHYSERSDGAGVKPTELKIKASPADSAPAASTPQLRWKEQARPSQGDQAATPKQPPRPPKSLSNGREDGTDVSRCALARDVLSGAVRHPNGAKTDRHDLEVAESDVRLFCR